MNIDEPRDQVNYIILQHERHCRCDNVNDTENCILPSLSLPFIVLSSPAPSHLFHHPPFPSVLFNYALLPLPACSLHSPVLFSTTLSFFRYGLPTVDFPRRFLAFSVMNNEITIYPASPSSLFLAFTSSLGICVSGIPQNQSFD